MVLYLMVDINKLLDQKPKQKNAGSNCFKAADNQR